MLTNAFFFFFFWLFVFYWIRYLHHRWLILMTFFKLFSSESAVPTSDVQLHWYSTTLIFYGKTRSLNTDCFFSSWIHGNKQKHLNNTQISGMIYLFYLLNRICCRNDSKSVHISVVRSVCTIMCLWPSLCMFWLYCLVNKIQIIKKLHFFNLLTFSLPASKSQSHWWAISSL